GESPISLLPKVFEGGHAMVARPLDRCELQALGSWLQSRQEALLYVSQLRVVARGTQKQLRQQHPLSDRPVDVVPAQRRESRDGPVPGGDTVVRQAHFEY